jgi:methylsterol monooxygenase
MCRNSTTIAGEPVTYWGQYEQVSKYNPHLNAAECLWAAWYAYMQNDVLATGIMSFVMHEIVYFGRALPWIIIDRIPYFNRYKIQNVSFPRHLPPVLPLRNSGPTDSLFVAQNKIPTVQEQWNCARLVLISHFTVELPQIWCVLSSI